MSEWETKAAIREIINAYSGAAGRLDIKAFTEFFTEDAEVHGIATLLGQPEPLAGRGHIGTFFGRTFDNVEWLSQMNNTTDIALSADGKRAKTSTGLVEMAQRKGASMIVLIGRYDDELQLTERGWRFNKRTFTAYRFSQVE